MRFLTVAAACALALSAAPSFAAPIIYSINDAVGPVGKLTGTITTDGTTGVLGAANIVSYNLNVVGNGATTNLNSGNSGVYVGGNSLSATSSALTFNFSNSNPSYLLFQAVFSTGTQFACAASTPFNSTPCYQGLNAVPVSYNDSTAQYSGEGAGGAPLTGTYVVGTAVPEPATWAMMLLGFGMVGFGLRSRRAGKVTTKVAFA